MTREGYGNVSVPSGIHAALIEIVNDEESLYTSVSDLVKEALREKVITVRSQAVVPSKKKTGGCKS